MSGTLVPVLWLCGPPGVGKTTVAWEIYSQLTQAGIEVGYVDIDQLGICYPESAADPGRHRLKAANLGDVVAGFRAVGARCVIVSGVVDAVQGVHVGEIPRVALTVCRLRAGHDELAQRFTGRGGEVDLVEAVLREADAMDASDFADVCVDTSGLPAADVARLVRERAGGWTVRTGRSRPAGAVVPDDGRTTTTADGPVLLLCGATGVGKSTVGFAIYQRILRTGRTGAYLDLDQVGFATTAPAGEPGNHRLRARNMAALWQRFRTAGAEFLVAVGPVEDEATVKAYKEALPTASITVCRLHAGPEELKRRIMLRGQGGSWSQPGDPLIGQPTAHLLQAAAKATADVGALERAALGDVRINTGGCTAEEAADAILARTGWPVPPE